MIEHVCKACGAVKPATEFRVHKNGYRIGKCRMCENAYQRARSAANPEEYRKRKRISMAKRRAADPDAARAYDRDYYRKNREKVLAKMKAYQDRRFFWRRSIKLQGVTPSDLSRLWKKQRGRCALTGEKLDRSAEVDHILPKARGGSDDLENLRWVTQIVNRSKRDLTDEEFTALCTDVMRWIGKRINAFLP